MDTAMKTITVIPREERKVVHLSKSAHQKAGEMAASSGQTLTLWLSLLVEREYKEQESSAEETVTPAAS